MSHQQGPVNGDSVDTDQPPNLNFAMVGVMSELERSTRLQFQFGPGRARQRAGVSMFGHGLCRFAGTDAAGSEPVEHVLAKVDYTRPALDVGGPVSFMTPPRESLRFRDHAHLWCGGRIVLFRIDLHDIRFLWLSRTGRRRDANQFEAKN